VLKPINSQVGPSGQAVCPFDLFIENKTKKGQNLRKWWRSPPYPHRHRDLLHLRQLLAAGHRYRHFTSTPLHGALESAVLPPPAPTTTTPPSALSTPAAGASPASRSVRSGSLARLSPPPSPRESYRVSVVSPQNYMLNSQVNQKLVAAAGVEAGDVVLEIGPGTGSLAAALLEAGATVFAVEKVDSVACFFFLLRSLIIGLTVIATHLRPCRIV
jgi:hypothetical protein